MDDVSFGDGDGSIDPSSEENRMLHAPATTERQFRRLRTELAIAKLAHRLESLEPGMRVIIVFDVGSDGKRRWSLAHCTEESR